MSEIPMEAKNLMREFLAQQKAEEQRKSQERAERSSKRDQKSVSISPMSSKDVQRYARQSGFDVIGGGGRHGVQLVSPTGERCPLPAHGGRDLARGTQRSVVFFIHQNVVIHG